MNVRRTVLALAVVALAAPAAVAANSVLTGSELSADLLAGADVTAAPGTLDPPLSTAMWSMPLIVTNGCHLRRAGLESKPCVYGDRRSHTTVVLFGDSHAAAWFPALDLISKQQHWRLVDLTKDGCPPVEVNITAWWRRYALYPECVQWRMNAMLQIAAWHPALVVVTWSRYLEEPEARPLAGVPSGHGSTWLDGLAASFSFLRRASRRVLFISDVPTLHESAPRCVADHRADVRACTTDMSRAIRLADVKAQELSLAASEGVHAIDPTSWFCTATACPVIVRDFILYRDNSHMVPAWSRFIAPVLAGAVVPIMRTKGTSASG